MNKWLKYYLPNIWESLLILLIFFFVGSLIAGAVIVAIFGLQEMPNADMTLLYIIPIIPVFLYIYIRSYTCYKSAKVFDAAGDGLAKAPHIKIDAPVSRSQGRRLSWVVIGLILLIGTLVLGYALDPLMSSIEMTDALKSIYEKMDFNNPSAMFSIVVLAPLCEEFIFRGTILRGVANKQTPAAAIVVSAILFGIIHLNLMQGVGAAIIGLFIGYTYYKSHSIWAAVFVHFVNNGSSFLAAALLPKECSTMKFIELLEYFKVSDPQFVYWTVVYASALIFILCIWLLYKYLPKVNTFKTTQA